MAGAGDEGNRLAGCADGGRHGEGFTTRCATPRKGPAAGTREEKWEEKREEKGRKGKKGEAQGRERKTRSIVVSAVPLGVWPI